MVIEAGSELVFESGASLEVGYFNSGYEYPGNLLVAGTAEAPVVMRGLASAPGSWSRLRVVCVNEALPVRLKNLEIRDACTRMLRILAEQAPRVFADQLAALDAAGEGAEG